MKSLMTALLNDDTGFIISAELVLVATIAVLSMVVGLAEVANNISQELEDVGSAFACLDQSFEFNGLRGHCGWISGSAFFDTPDFCAGECDIQSSRPQAEN